MKKGPLQLIVLAGVFLGVFFYAGPSKVPDVQAASKFLDIRQWSAPDHTRVVIDLDGLPPYETPLSPDPLILIVHLQKVDLPKGKREIPVNDPVIRKIKVEPSGQYGAKVILFLVKPARWKVFALKPYQDKPDRLVIDIFRPDLEEKEKAERQVSQELKTKKKRIVVLDPGHGGEDPGAIGPGGSQEKNIALNLARKLQRAFDESGEARAFLTRRGDYFVPLNERIKIAREYRADLFISIHTNGSRKRQTRGTSIYCLSLKGASDTATQLLAQKENASDMMGGTFTEPARKDLDSILLDLEQTHTINESLHLGGLMLSELGRVNLVQFSQPRQAGFAVLKAPNIPSILVETAYITHPLEEKLLKKDGFQSEVSRAILTAVKKFMDLLAVKEEGSGPEQIKIKGQKNGG